MDEGGLDRGSGPPAVLIHGQPGEGADWAALATALEDRFRVLAPDRPGWGSNPVPATDIAGNAAWLEALLQRRLGGTPVIAVGHSFGGGVALALAMSHPARIRALVLVGSIGHHAAVTRLDHLLARPAWGDAIVRTGTAAVRGAVSLVRRAVERKGRRGAPAPVRRPERISALRILAGEEPLPQSAIRSFSVEQRALVRETDALETGLGSIEVPTVVVGGTRDLVVGVAAARALAQAIPGAELSIVAGAGHLLPVEAPELLAGLVVRYDRLAGPLTDAPPPQGAPAA